MALVSQVTTRKTDSKPLPRVRLELLDVCGRLAQALNFPRSVGEIYGLLYLSPNPMSAQEIGDAISLSKGSISTGTRQLLSLGCIRKVWLQEERKDHFVAVLELGDLVRSAYGSIFKVRADNAERRLKELIETLAEEKNDLSKEDHAIIKDRLQRLVKLQKRAHQFLPIIERLIK